MVTVFIDNAVIYDFPLSARRTQSRLDLIPADEYSKCRTVLDTHTQSFDIENVRCTTMYIFNIPL